ncbi:LamG-like jellyroll fold domain-containing protein [Cellulomonas sp. URHB0016]
MQLSAFGRLGHGVSPAAPSRLRRLARTLAGLGSPLVLSTVVLGLAVAWLSLAGGLAVWTAAPTVAGWKPYVVVSDSMRPSIAAGDVVLISHDTGPDQWPLELGDVALMADEARQDGTRLHRVARFDADGQVVTKGDANSSEDAPAPPSQVLGRTRLVVPSIGLPIVWLRHGTYLPLLLVSTGTWLALVAVLRRRDPRSARSARLSRRARNATVVAHGTVLVLVAAALPAPTTSAALTSSRQNGASSFETAVLKSYYDTVMADSPSSYWRLNETSGLVLKDVTNAVPGTYSLAPVAVTGAIGTADKATTIMYGVQANKRQDTNLGNNYTFAGNQAFSVELWFRQLGPGGGYMRLISKENYVSDTSRSGWCLVFTPGGVNFARTLDSSVPWAGSTEPVTDQNWHHAVGTYDGAYSRMYYDGTLRMTVPAPDALRPVTESLQIGGRWADDSDHFQGEIDEVSIYANKVLTDNQVRLHYLTGKEGLP